MKMMIKSYYLSFYDLDETQPFSKWSMKSFLASILGITDNPPVFTDYQVPSDLTTNESVYNELLSLIYGRYYRQMIVRIDKLAYESAPTNEEYENAIYRWGFIFLSKLNMTYEYYMPLVNFYRSAQANLMDDIVATSDNQVAFNDTPENANTGNAYAGDDYITQFTKTHGSSSSPLTTKINRLKEIQEGYKNVMRDWVQEFEYIFLEVQGYEEH